MAEMTASEATEILLNLSWMVGTERRSQIAAMIEQQAQEIERLNQTWPNSCDFKDDDGCCLFPGAMTPECHADVCSVIKGLKQEIERLNKSLKFEQNYLSRVGTHAEGCYKWGPGHWDCAMREIAKKAKMLDMVIKKLSLSDCPMDRSYDLACPKWTEDGAGCAACWLAWLEKEAEGAGK